MRTISASRAVIGERKGAHELLAWSSEHDLFASLVLETDLPDQAPAGIKWDPFYRGWAQAGRYLLTRTEPDPTATRGGMVRTQVLAVDAGEADSLDDIGFAFRMLAQSWHKQMEISGIDLPGAESDNPTAAENVSPQVIALAEFLASGSHDAGPVAFLSQVGFPELLSELWRRLPHRFRKNFSFGFSFLPTDLKGRALEVVCVPSALAHRWIDYPRALPEKPELLVPSAAAGYVLRLPEGDAVVSLISEIGAEPKTLSDVPKYIGLSKSWKRREVLLPGEWRALCRDLVQVAPRTDQAQTAKRTIVQKLSESMQSAGAADILALRTVGIESLESAETLLATSVSRWIQERFSIGGPSDIADLNSIVDSLSRSAPEQWKKWVCGSIKASLGTAQGARTAWEMWRTNEATFKALHELAPQDAATEEGWLSSVPNSLPASLGELAAAWCERFHWLRLHALVLRAFLSLRDAVRRHIVVDSDPEHVDAIRALVASADPHEAAILWLEVNEPRVRACAAEVCAQEPSTFSLFEASSAGWRELIAEAMRLDPTFLMQLENAKSILYSLLDLLLGEQLDQESILECYASCNAANIIDYPRRGDIWPLLPSQIREEFLAQTAFEWVSRFYASPLDNPEVEPDLRRAIFSLPEGRLFPVAEGTLVTGSLRLLRSFSDAAERNFIAWIRAIVASKVALSADQANQVAVLLRDRGWEGGARALREAARTGSRSDLGQAWDAYWSALGLLERLTYKLSSLDTSSRGSLQKLAIDQPADQEKVDALIVTALPEEFGAARDHLEQVMERTVDGTVYGVGLFVSEGRSYRVALVQTMMGNPRAAMETERAIRRFEPRYAVFVGIGGGLKGELKVGDVIAASKVYSYESGKVETKFSPRSDTIAVSHMAEQRASAVAREGKWLSRIRSPIAAEPRAFVKPVAAGEKVLASTSSLEVRRIKKAYSDAYAVAMEDHGFAIAARANPGVTFAIVRGISDLVDGKSAADSTGIS